MEQALERRHGRPSAEPPTLSVVIPVYNSTSHLRQSLAALAASDYDPVDVLVVDDGSTECVEPVVRSHGFRYLRLEGPGGPARARNRGVERVRGAYIVFIDADVCVHPDTLSRFAERFQADSTLDALVGTYDDMPAAPNFLSQYKNLFHHYVHQSCDGPISTFWSGCGAIRRDLFIAWGGFDEHRYRRPAIEDIELGTWLSAAGYRIELDKTITATHLKHWTFFNMLKTDVRDRGIAWVRLMLRAGKIANTLNVKPTQRLSVALVYVALLTIGAAWWWPYASIGAVVAPLAVTLLNYDFYRYFRARRGLWFTMRAAPLHWLYFSYCGLCVVWGTALHHLQDTSASLVNASPRCAQVDHQRDNERL